MHGDSRLQGSPRALAARIDGAMPADLHICTLYAMPRPKSLTLHGIAAATLTVIDREGLAALSMRTVAQELGVGTMSLYRYVDDREQLEGLVVDLVLSAARTDLPARAAWTTRATLLMLGLRDSISTHPAVAPLVLTHRFAAESGLHWAEALLQVLTGAGFHGTARFIAFRSLVSYAVGAIQTEHFGPLPRPGEPLPAEQRPDEFPLLAQNAHDARRIESAEEFRRGLAVVLEGLRHKYLKP